ncbi:MAG: pirin family protein [Marinifilaceae bacterium]
MKVHIEHSAQRGHFNHGWLNTYHTFSFADYYNLKRMHFGALRVFNDDYIAPNVGFDAHDHKDMEIVTIPLYGMLLHKDSQGNEETIEPDEIQVMRAGRGITHSEYNASKNELVHLLQIWIYPRHKAAEPFYAKYNLAEIIKPQHLSTFISPQGPISIDQYAWFTRGKLYQPGEYPYHFKGNKHQTGLFMFVIDGMVMVGQDELRRGDSIQIVDTDRIDLLVINAADVLLIEVALDFRTPKH